MSEGSRLRCTPLEWLLANVLHYGTAVASALIAAGLVLSLMAPGTVLHPGTSSSGMRLVTAGIALFILLPVSRVVLMLVVFLRARDYRFGAIAAFVLIILFLGFLLGMRTASAVAR